MEDMDRKQKNDSTLQGVMGSVRKQWPRKGQLDVDLMQYFEVRDKLGVENGRLYNESKLIPHLFPGGKSFKRPTQGIQERSDEAASPTDLLVAPDRQRQRECRPLLSSCQRSGKSRAALHIKHVLHINLTQYMNNSLSSTLFSQIDAYFSAFCSADSREH